ncbi:MAG: T9SS type A sorting domain-containing protein [Chitinophagaceae bacterium]|nr:T9SS type A sorting domain-containing protein [Chitinophagaceae bacterium]
MKNYYLAFIIMFTALSASAQVPFKNLKPGQISGAEIQHLKSTRCPALGSNTRDIYEMYVDYSYVNYDDVAYLFQFSSDYTGVDTALNYSAVVLNNLVGYTDAADPANSLADWSVFGLNDSFPSNVQVTIDSIYMIAAHENNSGTFDKIEAQIVKTLSNGSPSQSASSILWSNKDSVDFGLSGSNDWLGGDAFVLGFGPGYTLDPGQKAAFNFIYHNATKEDTFAVVGGCLDDGQGGSVSPSSYATSYMRYPPFIPSVTKCVNIVYVDAQGNTIGYFAAQNWIDWFKVTINTELTGVADNFDNLDLTTIYPNPANNSTQILYGLRTASDVTIDLYDISGRLVTNLYKANDAGGSYVRNIDLSNVNAGAYMVSLKAGNGSPVVSKLIVSK